MCRYLLSRWRSCQTVEKAGFQPDVGCFLSSGFGTIRVWWPSGRKSRCSSFVSIRPFLVSSVRVAIVRMIRQGHLRTHLATVCLREGVWVRGRVCLDDRVPLSTAQSGWWVQHATLKGCGMCRLSAGRRGRQAAEDELDSRASKVACLYIGAQAVK